MMSCLSFTICKAYPQRTCGYLSPSYYETLQKFIYIVHCSYKVHWWKGLNLLTQNTTLLTMSPGYLLNLFLIYLKLKHNWNFKFSRAPNYCKNVNLKARQQCSRYKQNFYSSWRKREKRFRENWPCRYGRCIQEAFLPRAWGSHLTEAKLYSTHVCC